MILETAAVLGTWFRKDANTKLSAFIKYHSSEKNFLTFGRSTSCDMLCKDQETFFMTRLSDQFLLQTRMMQITFRRGRNEVRSCSVPGVGSSVRCDPETS